MSTHISISIGKKILCLFFISLPECPQVSLYLIMIGARHICAPVCVGVGGGVCVWWGEGDSSQRN